jgi:hypothetical protein
LESDADEQVNICSKSSLLLLYHEMGFKRFFVKINIFSKLFICILKVVWFSGCLLHVLFYVIFQLKSCCYLAGQRRLVFVNCSSLCHVYKFHVVFLLLMEKFTVFFPADPLHSFRAARQTPLYRCACAGQRWVFIVALLDLLSLRSLNHVDVQAKRRHWSECLSIRLLFPTLTSARFPFYSSGVAC